MSASFAFTPIPPSRTSNGQKPEIVSELAGMWRGQLLASGADVSTPFLLIRDASADAAVVGRFSFFSTRDVPPTGVRLLEASGSTFVALIGPYYDPEEDAEVVTILEGRRVENRITGKFNSRLVRGWRKGKVGRFVAARYEPDTK